MSAVVDGRVEGMEVLNNYRTVARCLRVCAARKKDRICDVVVWQVVVAVVAG